MTTAVDAAGKLRPYVPRLLRGESVTSGRRHWHSSGTMLFADISGFTRLSERLARQGKVGAEELATTISKIFTNLLSAPGGGGDVLKFGGDALLIFYEGPDHAVRACHSAHVMRRTLREVGGIVSSQGRVRLRMSVGVHSDSFDFFLVGEEHLELLVAGPAATRTLEIEAAADAGEILLSASTATAIDERWLGPQKAGGRLLRRIPQLPRVPLPAVAGDDAELENLLPRSLREHLGADVQEHEHRRVTIGFLHFGGVDELLAHGDAIDVLERLHRLVSETQAAAADLGVAILGSDIAPDGGKLILAAGAPEASEDDDGHMLRACRRIITTEVGLPVRIGVNRGQVFVGDVGAPFRRTYTVMGDAVNLAARIMGKAPARQLLAHTGVVERSSTTFDCETLEPFMVKGKSKPVEACRVGPPAQERRQRDARLRLFGRTKELGHLIEAVDAARMGHGSVVELVGDLGIGKTRLVSELVSRRGDLPALEVDCTPYEQSNPYSAARTLLRSALDIPAEADADAAGRLLTVRVEHAAPQLSPWLPLIAMVAGASVASNEHVDELAPRFRSARLHDAVNELLGEVLGPALIVIEDAVWIDEASSELLTHVLRHVTSRPWAVVTTRRTDKLGLRSGLGFDATVMELAPLELNAAAALVQAAAEAHPIPAPRRTAIVERAAGNPLFLLELVTAHQAGSAAVALPESVEAILSARIDRLDPSDRRALRYMSVLGLRFGVELLDQTLGRFGISSADTELWERLGDFVTRDAGGAFRFVQELFRETAYEGLTFERRRALHGRVAGVLETLPATPERSAVLSFHTSRAGQFEKAWRYSVQAGEEAQRQFANVEAAEFYRRALEAARGLDTLESRDLARVAELRGDVCELAGLLKEAAAAYSEARSAIPGNDPAQVRLMQKEGVISERLGNYPAALRWYTRGLKTAEHIAAETERARLRARLAAAYAGVRYRQGRLEQSAEWGVRAVNDATDADDAETLAHAYYLLAIAYADLGDPRSATYRDLALPIYERLGDLIGQANVLNNLGVFAYYEGRWGEALELYERSRAARLRAGDVVGAAMAAMNIGEVLSDQGYLERAEELLREARAVWQGAEYAVGVAYATSNLGRVMARSGQVEEGLRLLEDATAMFREIGAESLVLETRGRVAEALLLLGRSVEAWEAATEVLDKAGEVGDGVLVAFAERLRGQAFAQTRGAERARECLGKSVQAARELGAQYELALSLRALAELGDAEEEAATAERILAGLGVVTAAPREDVRTAAAKPAPTALVGRDTELATLTAELAAACAGKGQGVQLVGVAGVGKSRLLAELDPTMVRAARLEVVCEPYEMGTPYGAARRLLREALGVEQDAGSEEAAHVLSERVDAACPKLAPWLPLLALVVGASVPPTRETTELAPQFLEDRLYDAVDQLLEALVGPALIVIEDAGWIDPASMDVLAAVLRRVRSRPWLVVLTLRDLARSRGKLASLGVIRLGPLSADKAMALVAEATEPSTPPDNRLAAIAACGAGIPLYLLELAASHARGSGLPDLPDSVEKIIPARLEALAHADREALSHLSVLGRRFSAALLDAALGELGIRSRDAELWTRLEAFVEGEGDDSFAFRHELLRQAAYRRLPRQRRRELHARVAETLERPYDTAVEGRTALLSLHFLRAGRHEETWHYSVVAGEQAQARFAHSEAADFYRRALRAARHVGGLHAAEVARVAELLGDAYELAGRYPEATTAYERARASAADPATEARLLRKLGNVSERAGDYAQALVWLRRGLNVAASMPSEVEQAAARGPLEAAYAGVRYRQGQLADCVEWCERAAADAKHVGDSEALGQAYYLLDGACTELGDPRSGRYRGLALKIFEDADDLLGQAHALNSEGVSAYYEGRWDDALMLYARSRDAFERAGDVVFTATVGNNIGEILSDQGHLAEAEQLFHEALDVWRRAGYAIGVALATSNLGRAASRAGRTDEAFALLEEAVAGFGTIGAHSHLCDARARLAEALLAAGRVAEARDLVSEVLDMAANDGAGQSLIAMVHRLWGHARAATGELEGGRAALEESLRVSRTVNAQYETALTLQALAGLDADPDLAAEAERVFEYLGVMRAAEVRGG